MQLLHWHFQYGPLTQTELYTFIQRAPMVQYTVAQIENSLRERLQATDVTVIDESAGYDVPHIYR